MVPKKIPNEQNSSLGNFTSNFKVRNSVFIGRIGSIDEVKHKTPIENKDFLASVPIKQTKEELELKSDKPDDISEIPLNNLEEIHLDYSNTKRFNKIKIALETTVLNKMKIQYNPKERKMTQLVSPKTNVTRLLKGVIPDGLVGKIPDKVEEDIRSDIKKKVMMKRAELLFRPQNSNSALMKKGSGKSIISKFSGLRVNREDPTKKDRIEAINKLRSISRLAYSIGIAYDMTSTLYINIDITKMKKSLQDIKEINSKNLNLPSKNIDELFEIIEEKLRIIREISVIKRCIDTLDKKGFRPEVFQQIIQIADDEEIGSPIAKSSSLNNSSLSPSFNNIKKSTSKFVVLDKKRSSRELLNFQFPMKEKLMNSHSSMVSEESMALLIDSQHFPSARLVRKKHFEQNALEEYIGQFFLKIVKPIRKYKSCVSEFGRNINLEHDKRRNLSCTLDYIINYTNLKHRKKLKSNSTINLKITSEDTTTVGSKVTIKDFDIMKGLSSGAYGKVCLVKKKTSGDYFAMKIIDKETTTENSQENFIRSEVTIMRNLDSDYVVKLYYSFQNDRYLFFVMEYMNGGDLGNVLQLFGTIDEKVKVNLIIVCTIICCRDSSCLRISAFQRNPP